MSIEKFIKDNKAEFDDKRMPSDIDFNFENRLKQELYKPKRFKVVRNLSIAASLTLLVTLGYLYNENRKQQLEFRDSLVLALDEETNSSQLEAIYTIEDEYKAEDEKILNAYFKILKAKSNSNSKIAIIDALLKFPNNQQVKDNLIEALGNEKEPLVQLKLIKSVAILREQRAKKSLETIIEDDESLPLVKGNASALLAMLNN